MKYPHISEVILSKSESNQYETFEIYYEYQREGWSSRNISSMGCSTEEYSRKNGNRRNGGPRSVKIN